MTRLPNPAWRVPTRPCPFYSQGKCLFFDACNFIHDVKITPTPIKSADIILLPQISYTSPLSEHHPEPVIVTSNPFLEDEAPLDRLQAIVESPEAFQETEQLDSSKVASPTQPIRVVDATDKRVHRYLGLPNAPLYLNELKNYQKQHHLRPSPNSTVQELSYAEESNNNANMFLQPIVASSLMQSRRAAQDNALDDCHIWSTEAPETSLGLGLLNVERPAEASLQMKPLTSTPRRKPRGLRPLRLPTLRTAPLSPATPAEHPGQSSPTREPILQELCGQDSPTSLIPSPIGPFGVGDFQNMEDPQLHTMTLSELDGGSKEADKGALKGPNSDSDASMFFDDTSANGLFETSGNTSMLDEIYGTNESSRHSYHAMLAQTTPSLSSTRPPSLSTTESELTAVIGIQKCSPVASDPSLREPSPAVPSNVSGEEVLSHHGHDFTNTLAFSRPTSRMSQSEAPAASTESTQSNGRVSSISSSEDMYRRPLVTQSLERPRQVQVQSLTNILGAIDEVRERSATPPLRLTRPSSRATTASALTPSESAPSTASPTAPAISGPTLPSFSRGSLAPSRRLTIQTTGRHDDPSPSRSHTPSTIPSATTSSAPHLFFALASDSPAQVSNILNSGQANPNDTAGPDDLPALVFSLTNDQLRNKTEIVKTLLSHGADPSVVQHLVPPRAEGSRSETDAEDIDDSPLTQKLRGSMNPAIEYYLGRQNAATRKQVEALQERHYDPLLRARFHIIGQDLALDEMMRSVASHSRRKGSVASLALVLTGPSGHGKSHLASKIGTLLQSPLYIVNMTNLRTQEDLMRARSLARESDESLDLLSFLKTYEGKRCVVVLEEIEKTAEKHVLHSLLMPWELGRLPASPANSVVDTSEVIWVCTSNSGEELVFEFSHHNGTNKLSSREQYKKLMSRMRSHLANELGASIVSRVQGVLPFLPFTRDEQRALASEMLDKLNSQTDDSAGAANTSLTTAAANEIVDLAIQDYIEREGARSIHRAVQELHEEKLMDM